MNFKVPAVVSRALFRLQRRSPEIATGSGIVLIAYGAFKACQKTYELSPILEGHKADLEVAKDLAEKNSEYKDSDDYKHDLTAIYKRMCIDTAKLYMPPIAFMAIGIGLIIGGHRSLRKQNMRLAASLLGINTAFDEYRHRVIEDLGEEADAHFRTGATMTAVEETYTDEKGKEKTRKTNKLVADPKAKGKGHLKYFTPANPYWNDDIVMLEMFFNQQQNYMNDMFRINKRYTIGELWDRLGFPVNEDDPDELVDGWLKGQGQQFIELNVTKCEIPDEYGNYIPAYAIDPNVQCNIYQTLKRSYRKALQSSKEVIVDEQK